MNFNSRWVLVTGASSGLGLEMARQLARDHHANVILLARRQDRLLTLKTELEQYGVQVQIVIADLGIEADVKRAFQEATAEHDVYGAILNAGTTYFGEHLKLSWEELKAMLDVNVNAVALLTHLFVPYLLDKHQQGGVMLVGSMSGVTTVPYQTAYSATKAFLFGFGHGLWHELRDRDVSLTTFVPGGIATEMSEKSGLANYFGRGGFFVQSAEACARDALDAFRRRKHTYVAGFANQAGVVVGKILPRSVMVGQVAAQYRKALALKNKS